LVYIWFHCYLLYRLWCLLYALGVYVWFGKTEKYGLFFFWFMEGCRFREKWISRFCLFYFIEIYMGFVVFVNMWGCCKCNAILKLLDFNYWYAEKGEFFWNQILFWDFQGHSSLNSLNSYTNFWNMSINILNIFQFLSNFPYFKSR
jgi:hypothetical protein